MKRPQMLKNAKNIGSTVLKRLNEIGVYSLADLATLTPAKAYQKICQNYPDKTIPVCYYLYSLEGALRDMHWNDLPLEVKEHLKRQVGK